MTHRFIQSIAVVLAPGLFIPLVSPSAQAAAPLFVSPTGIAVDSHGDVFVADAGARRITELSPTGTVLRTIGASGGLHLQGKPRLALGPRDSVYVLEGLELHNGGVVQSVVRLDTIGRVTAHWTGPTIRNAESFAVGGGGNVFLLSPIQTRAGNTTTQLVKITTTGKTAFAVPLDRARYDVAQGLGVAVDRTGAVYVTAVGVRCSRGCQGADAYLLEKYAPSGRRLWTRTVTRVLSASLASGLVASRASSLYSYGAAYVTRFSVAGKVLSTLGSVGCAPGKFRDLQAGALAPDGTLYLADAANANVQSVQPGGAAAIVAGGCPATPGPPQPPA